MNILTTLLVGALVSSVCANENEFDTQQIQQFSKSVKGGPGNDGFHYNPAANQYIRFFGNNTDQGFQGYNMRRNLTAPIDLEVGVCYIEVPTASLVRDASHVPAGNGSRPDLSRIRSCCKGYIRNIHNFRKCDPVCSQECVNALCTAPETCTCFPDHVKNLGGFCIPTCPIGCQNGRCDGGECMCKDGFKLDANSKFCVPLCRENCGGIGNCTAPNYCECKPGYQSSPEGSCKPMCDRCVNGDCVAPNECRCRQGFTKNPQGICTPRCEIGYEDTPHGCRLVCTHCPNGQCVGGICRCDFGFTKDSQGLCVAACSPDCGPNSRCVAPNVCDPPQSRYVPNPAPAPLYPGNQVVPQTQNTNAQCSQVCLNGYCVDGNRCACNRGYVIDRNDASGNKCVPFCPGGCPNGVCSAPNFCICNMGYVKDHSVKGQQNCVKRVRRSVDQQKPLNVAELLTFEIDDDF